ncbi:hypothetical protein [Archangium sp.]|uniref:hypothetical protein n=1 Tax=Archangium sp. TaxID=1872627 RepID=UPI002D59B60F|nr:hypothetical protein [Archangium sp.]HYO55504.1 hypothetical protein [Archangium sp.]
MKEPGQKLTANEAKPVIQQFWSTFRDPAKKGGPTWLRLKTQVRATPAVLKSSALDGFQMLYVFFEYERALWSASASDIRNYFERRSPGDYADVYVFPPTMQWCIAYTAEDNMGEDVVLLAGDVDLFRG